MTGSLVVHDRPLARSERRYAVLRAALDDGRELVYDDVRRLGTLLLLDQRGWNRYTQRHRTRAARARVHARAPGRGARPIPAGSEEGDHGPEVPGGRGKHLRQRGALRGGHRSFQTGGQAHTRASPPAPRGDPADPAAPRSRPTAPRSATTAPAPARRAASSSSCWSMAARASPAAGAARGSPAPTRSTRASPCSATAASREPPPRPPAGAAAGHRSPAAPPADPGASGEPARGLPDARCRRPDHLRRQGQAAPNPALTYFRAEYPDDKAARILYASHDITWDYTPSEFSAYLGELRQIKQYRPALQPPGQPDAAGGVHQSLPRARRPGCPPARR